MYSGTMSCPACQVYDAMVNDCVDPCVEYGSSSLSCERYGCPAAVTTAVHTITAGQSSVAADLLGLPEEFTIVIVLIIGFVVVIIILLLVVLCRCRRRHQPRINDTSRILQLSSRSSVYDL